MTIHTCISVERAEHAAISEYVCIICTGVYLPISCQFLFNVRNIAESIKKSNDENKNNTIICSLTYIRHAYHEEKRRLFSGDDVVCVPLSGHGC